jgi:hypothetical protein
MLSSRWRLRFRVREEGKGGGVVEIECGGRARGGAGSNARHQISADGGRWHPVLKLGLAV